MSDLAKRFPIGQMLSSAIDSRITGALQAQGWCVPCTVKGVDDTDGFVTVQIDVQNFQMNPFEVVLPVIGWQYIRFPIQKGDRGITTLCDVSLTNAIGESNVAPSIKPAGNITDVLAFQPIMNLKYVTSPNKNAVVIYGPEGAIITCYDFEHKQWGSTKITLDATAVTIAYGTSASVVVKDGEVDITGTLKINGHEYLQHKHSGVQTGSGTSGAVVP